MTKKQFKESFEELVWTYLRDNRGKKNIPYTISCDYMVNEDRGSILFEERTCSIVLKIPKIDFKG